MRLTVVLTALLLLPLVTFGQNVDQLKFATTGQVATAGLNAFSPDKVYDSSMTFFSQVFPMADVDSIWGSFWVGDTCDVDIYIRHIRFSGNLTYADTSGLLDSLATGLGGGVISGVLHRPGAYRSWEGFQWMLKFQSFAISSASATKALRVFRGNQLRKSI